jgi:hypothetical protein
MTDHVNGRARDPYSCATIYSVIHSHVPGLLPHRIVFHSVALLALPITCQSLMAPAALAIASPRYAITRCRPPPHRLSTSRVRCRHLHPLKSQNSNLVGNNSRCVAPPVPPPCSSTVELPAALLNPAPLTTRKGGGSHVHTLHDGYWRTMGSSASVNVVSGGEPVEG